jgi:hypothetical protein
LDGQGLIEAKGLTHVLDVGLRRVRAGDQRRRIAGDQVHHREHRERDPEQNRDRLQQPAGQKSKHLGFNGL